MKRDIIRSLLGGGPQRRSRVNAADLRILHTDSNDPDSIGIEAWDGDDLVFEIVADCHGAKALWIGKREFERDQFLTLLNRCTRELDTWESKLREPGAVWEHEEKRSP